MTVNINSTPNHLIVSGDTHVVHWFGAVSAVTAVPNCTHPHIDVVLENHVHLQISAATSRDLVRRVQAVLGSLPFPVDAVRDSVGEDL